MKILEANFVRSAYSPQDFPADGFPQIAFAGRSNVGKSSMINSLLKRKNLARTSSQPGKTRSINFIMLNGKYYFVDLPGYGFARVSKQEREQWRSLINSFLLGSPSLRGLIHIIDARIGLTKSDEMMLLFGQETGIDTLVAATKWDKLKKREQEIQSRAIIEKIGQFGLETFQPFSAKTGFGRPEVWKWIDRRLSRQREERKRG